MTFHLSSKFKYEVIPGAKFCIHKNGSLFLLISVLIINRSLNSTQRFQNSILLVNSPGYQGSSSSRIKLSDLAYNYLQDRWNSCLYYNAITRSKQRFRQEDIEVDIVIPDNDDDLSCVDIVDSPGHIQSNKSKGIFWLIEEEASSPGGTSQTLIERILYNFNKNQKGKLFNFRISYMKLVF